MKWAKRIVGACLIFNTVAPLFIDFGTWCNVIQWLSGYGIPVAVYAWLLHHKKQLDKLHQKIEELIKDASTTGK